MRRIKAIRLDPAGPCSPLHGPLASKGRRFYRPGGFRTASGVRRRTRQTSIEPRSIPKENPQGESPQGAFPRGVPGGVPGGRSRGAPLCPVDDGPTDRARTMQPGLAGSSIMEAIGSDGHWLSRPPSCQPPPAGLPLLIFPCRSSLAGLPFACRVSEASPPSTRSTRSDWITAAISRLATQG